MRGQPLSILGPLFTLSTFLALASAHPAPYASVTADDGTTYTFHRAPGISAQDAAAACAAADATLASMTSPEQVSATIWSEDVVQAAAAAAAPTLLWTGLRIRWDPPPQATRRRRLLRDTTEDGEASGGRWGHEAHSHTAYDRIHAGLASAGAAAGGAAAVPATAPNGRPLPAQLRASLYGTSRAAATTATPSISTISAHRHRRALQLRGQASAGPSLPALQDAVLEWADGSPAGLLAAGAPNMGFYACDPTRHTQCCGAVYDVGPGPYAGHDFPTVFFYPCEGGTDAGTDAEPPGGYACAARPVAVAALERPRGGERGGARQTDAAAAAAACRRCRQAAGGRDGRRCGRCPAAGAAAAAMVAVTAAGGGGAGGAGGS